jgi:NitT/TauT family transport system substrate-binding protein
MLLGLTLLLSIYGIHVVYSDASDDPIRVAYLQNDIHHLPLWIAIEKRMFEEQGIRVKVEGIFRSGPEVMSAFSGKAIDLAYVGEAPTVTALANGTVDVGILAQVNTEGSAIVIRSDSEIANCSGLRGKQIAVPGYSTVQDLLLRKSSDSSGLDGNGPKVMVLRPPEMISALRTNQIEGFIAWEPYPSQAVKMDIGKILVGSCDIWKDHPCCVLVVDKRFGEKNRARLEKIRTAHDKSIDFIHNNFDEAVRIAVKYTGLDEEIVRKAMGNVTYVGEINLEGLEEYVNFLNGYGYIKIRDIPSFIKRIIF